AQFVSNSPTFYSNCLPGAGLDFAIFLLWADLATVQITTGNGCQAFPSGCGIFTSTTGTAPNRQLHIEWRATMYNAGNNHYDCQLRLFKGSSTFEVLFVTMCVPFSGRPGHVSGVHGTS